MSGPISCKRVPPRTLPSPTTIHVEDAQQSPWRVSQDAPKPHREANIVLSGESDDAHPYSRLIPRIVLARQGPYAAPPSQLRVTLYARAYGLALSCTSVLCKTQP
ncbi:hypothetical protein PsYK624_039870 [Phanerochaete sordida]|uniref:Uncharacterized protein n=1 Tax=Phanerochaete sordida TaxID=48140 RepID=A0A9P3G5J5_9APHY|nr:hypothetical protein PsYK624_039870 [Phanerochaete sordida]